MTVTGYVRADGTGSSTRIDDLSTRALSSVAAEPAIGHRTYGGWVHLHSEDPEPDASQPVLTAAELPDLSNGPHFFYGLQWWFFGVLALFGFCYLLYDEWRTSKSGRDGEVVAERARARTERSEPRDAKLTRKQAVKAAYQEAYEKERLSKRD